MKSKKYIVKAIDDVWENAIEDLGIKREDLEATVIGETEAGLEVEVKTTADGITKGLEFIQILLIENQVGGEIEKRLTEEGVEYNVLAGRFNGVLIGKESRHLKALQTLVSTIVNNYYEPGEQKKVKVDVADYKYRQERRIEQMAVEYGKQVASSKERLELEGLNAYERKLVHDKLGSWSDVATHSEGEEPNRRLIIEPVEQ